MKQGEADESGLAAFLPHGPRLSNYCIKDLKLVDSEADGSDSNDIDDNANTYCMLYFLRSYYIDIISCIR